MNSDNRKEKFVIANCSGFFGDRFSAAREMVSGGKIDVLTGDYLAELTMAILYRSLLKDPKKGYVRTFLKQMEEILGSCLDRKIRVVTNAGGLNPEGLAEELEKKAKIVGVNPTIACITGDDLMPGLNELEKQGECFRHSDDGVSLKKAGGMPITANAYTGAWGIVKALEQGADIVVGGRIADAALVAGPAAWKFGWRKNDWDRLAGGYLAGHIIECGTQATGGNYSFIDEVPLFKNMGFPIAEVYEDGSFVITKHPKTGGLVSVGTVTAQLLYEIREPCYLTPDVRVCFDSVNMEQEAKDRVLVNNVRGESPTGKIKVCINNFCGYRNSMTVILTGLDIEKKAKIVEQAIFESMGGKDEFEVADVQLIRSDKADPKTNEESFAYLRICVMDRDEKKVGRVFSSKVVEMALGSIPGFTLTHPPAKASPAICHWPALVSGRHVEQKVVVGRNEFIVKSVLPENNRAKRFTPTINRIKTVNHKMVKIALGRVFATRSGDKGGNANLGIWGKTDMEYAYLNEFLTIDKLKELLPDIKEFEVERYELPNLFALNFYIKGMLGKGVSAGLRIDPQAKTLGEYLRAKEIEVPYEIVH